MIHIGLTHQQKTDAISDFIAENGITSVVILSPEKFIFKTKLSVKSEVVEYADIIMYKYFYRLLQEIDNSTLVVINECLRTQNRHDLTYNCIRHFLTQTKHQLVFQYLPVIDTIEDFMILFDFDSQSRFKREHFDIDLLSEVHLSINKIPIEFNLCHIAADEKLKAAYAKKKASMFDTIGNKDPHTLPRNLYLIGGKLKSAHAKGNLVGRNDRFKLGVNKYKQTNYPDALTIFEFPHNFIDFCDVISLTHQHCFDVLATDLKADKWYCTRYQQWSHRLNETYTSLLKR